jgi:hypothetical protein
MGVLPFKQRESSSILCNSFNPLTGKYATDILNTDICDKAGVIQR